MYDLDLSPSQQTALVRVSQEITARHVTVLAGRSGYGKTTILQALHSRLGGAYLTTRDFIEASTQRHPLALDETVYEVVKSALLKHQAVLVDDFHNIAAVLSHSHSYPRSNFLAAALLPLAALARSLGKPLVFTTEHYPLPGLHQNVNTVAIKRFTIDDYTALCNSYLGSVRARLIDLQQVYRFAPRLDARQIRSTCEALREGPLDTERFVEYLREHHLASNVDLGEVQAVDLKDLKGVDDVLDALEANVILPLENAEVAEELSLKPKRGVLLAGPPGTGKTTIGRALAHRLRSKFFLIDGTVVSGTAEFYHRIQQIFEAAKQNAPSIIFIDDSDVIFESGQETGLYRYLLTMLDGLETASVGRVSVVMTAMDVGSMPPALVRSGRIELWLETRLPDALARHAILADRCVDLPAAIGTVDIEQLAAATEGLSGADLKRVIEDGKLLFAFERTRNAQMQPATEYFLRGIEIVRRNQQQYAEAEARARARENTHRNNGGWAGYAAHDPSMVFAVMESEAVEP